MKLSVLLFFTYLFYVVVGQVPERAPLTKVYRWNDPTIDTIPNKSFADQVNLNIKVSSNGVDYSMTVSTRSLDSWLVSTTCASRFCKFSKNKIPTPEKQPSNYIAKYQVQGVSTTIPFSIYGGDTIAAYDVYAATEVDNSVGKRLASKHTNGILSLKHAPLENLGVDNVVSLMTSGGDQYMGIYNSIPTTFLEDRNSVNQIKNSINLALTSNEWTARLYYIRNTRGEWHTWCVGGCTAIFDTTYNGISGPANDINSINAFIGADGNGMIDCDKVMTLEPLTFVLNNRQYTLDAKHYIMESQDKFESQCQSAFKVNDADDTGDNQWRLGLPFFDQHLTVIQYDDNFVASAVTFLRLKNRLPKLPKTNV